MRHSNPPLFFLLIFQLEQLKSEDPLPLRRAKINQTASLRKMEKAAAPFNEASAKANAAAC